MSSILSKVLMPAPFVSIKLDKLGSKPIEVIVVTSIVVPIAIPVKLPDVRTMLTSAATTP